MYIANISVFLHVHIRKPRVFIHYLYISNTRGVQIVLAT